MPSPNVNKTSNRNPTHKNRDLANPTYGIYLAEVIATTDVARTGRLRVFIPVLSQDKQNRTGGYYNAIWSSPFAGITDPTNIGENLENPRDSLQSYGLWMVPPDIGNQVLVAFADNNLKYPVVISCLFHDRHNHMVPGLPGSKTFQVSETNMPSVERNKLSGQLKFNDIVRPIHHTLAESIVKQGLIHDPVRGVSTSGARREAPSEVFGILTPGPNDPNEYKFRLGGHQFIMDDNLSSRNIRIRTAKGHQILMDDTEGCMYFITNNGKVWMEFDSSGSVHMYSENGINFRTKGDFNVRADKNINLEAGNNLRLKAAGDINEEGHQGNGVLGDVPTGLGGLVIIESQANTHITASNSIFTTSVSGSLHFNSTGEVNTTAKEDINFITGMGIKTDIAESFSNKVAGDIIFQNDGTIVMKTTQVLVNSGGPDASEPAEATPSGALETIEFTDLPPGEIPYEAEEENPLPTGGVRSGEAPNVLTIVSTYVTAEPWIGHGISDPRKSGDPGTQPADPMVAEQNMAPTGTALENNQGETIPASINAPEGYQKGMRFEQAEAILSEAVAAPNNFSKAIDKAINKIANIASVVGGLAAAIPSIKVPELDALGGTVLLGSMTKLKGIEAQTKQLGIDKDGIRLGADNPVLGNMKEKLSMVMSVARNAADFSEKIAKEGLMVTQDAGGVRTILDTATGTTIKDFKNTTNISDEENRNLIMGEIGMASMSVKSLISKDINLSDNQFVAMTNMATQIGPRSLAESRALQCLNKGEFDKVPNAMLDFSFAPQNDTREVPKVSQEMKDRRTYEGELFQTPDYVPLPNYGNRMVPWKQQAMDLRGARDTFFQG